MAGTVAHLLFLNHFAKKTPGHEVKEYELSGIASQLLPLATASTSSTPSTLLSPLTPLTTAILLLLILEIFVCKRKGIDLCLGKLFP